MPFTASLGLSLAHIVAYIYLLIFRQMGYYLTLGQLPNYSAYMLFTASFGSAFSTYSNTFAYFS